jgi:hypothetical protein
LNIPDRVFASFVMTRGYGLGPVGAPRVLSRALSPTAEPPANLPGAAGPDVPLLVAERPAALAGVGAGSGAGCEQASAAMLASEPARTIDFIMSNIGLMLVYCLT